jgi:hypothetical protein
MNSFRVLCPFRIDKLGWIKSGIPQMLTYRHGPFWKLLKVSRRYGFDGIRYTLELLRAENALAGVFRRFME